MDICNYDLILGDPWLQTRNPDIDWAERTWGYTKKSSLLELTRARAFFEAAAEAQHLYAIYYIPGSSKGKPELPAKYEDFKDVFLEDKANELILHS